MTAVIHVQTVLPPKSGLVKDSIVNTFTFRTEAGLDATLHNAIDGAIHGFYNLAHPGATDPIGQYIGAEVARQPITTKHYEVSTTLSGTPAGSPIWQGSLAALPAVGFPSMPAQVSICLSFHSAFASDVEFGPGGIRPRSRDRGRVYLGPMVIQVGTTLEEDSTTGEVRPPDAFKNLICQNAVGAFSGVLAGTDAVEWCVWSRKAARVSPVEAVSVDDVFDTQRRRAPKPRSKIIVAMP